MYNFQVPKDSSTYSRTQASILLCWFRNLSWNTHPVQWPVTARIQGNFEVSYCKKIWMMQADKTRTSTRNSWQQHKQNNRVLTPSDCLILIFKTGQTGSINTTKSIIWDCLSSTCDILPFLFFFLTIRYFSLCIRIKSQVSAYLLVVIASRFCL